VGIKDFLPHYVGGGGTESYPGFAAFNFSQEERIVLDAAGLLFSCAVQHASSYLAHDYTPALQALQGQIIYR
jgi:hypothetical protein